MRTVEQTLIEAGRAYTIAAASGNVIGYVGDDGAGGAQLRLGKYEHKPEQEWLFDRVGENSYRIHCRANGKVIDLAMAGTANGTWLQLWDDVLGGSQMWTLVPVNDGTVRIISQWASGRCVDTVGIGTAAGAILQIWQAGPSRTASPPRPRPLTPPQKSPRRPPPPNSRPNLPPPLWNLPGHSPPGLTRLRPLPRLSRPKLPLLPPRLRPLPKRRPSPLPKLRRPSPSAAPAVPRRLRSLPGQSPPLLPRLRLLPRPPRPKPPPPPPRLPPPRSGAAGPKRLPLLPGKQLRKSALPAPRSNPQRNLQRRARPGAAFFCAQARHTFNRRRKGGGRRGPKTPCRKAGKVVNYN